MASRLVSGPIALPFVEGTSLFASRGMTGATGNWYCGLHEVGDMAFVLHMLRRGEQFPRRRGKRRELHGAGSGRTSGAQVTSVEPVSRTFAHLQRNVTLNGLSETVIAWQGGLSDSARHASIHDRSGCRQPCAPSKASVNQAVEVAVRTLDDLVGSERADAD